MRPQKISTTSVLSALTAPTSSLPKVTRRLLKELKAFENSQTPLANVAALPLDNNLFVWHGNISGTEDTIYEGLMVHFKLEIPQTYPRQPPTIEILTEGDIKHPNIFGKKLCLDILEKSDKDNIGIIWNSSYTIRSILQQLQSFFIDGYERLKSDKQMGFYFMKNMEKFNGYYCQTNGCKHRGNIESWPKMIHINDFEIEKEFKNSIISENKFYEESLKCFYTQLSHTENTLGVGLRVTRLAKTAEIHNCIAVDDLISFKAFNQEKIRKSSKNEIFTYWMPLFFSKIQKSKVLYLASRSCSFILTNNTNSFEPLMAAKVFSRAIFSLFVRIADKKIVSTNKAVRQLVQLHGMMLVFIQKYPEIEIFFDSEIQRFLENEEERTKEKTPQMGIILIYCMFSTRYNFGDVIEEYFMEQVDRQVFWILKKIPELEDTEEAEVIKEARIDVTFQVTITGLLISCHIKDYYTSIKNFKEKNLLDFLENNFISL